MLRFLGEVREKVLDRARVRPDDVVLDVGTGTGLLAVGALERLGGGGEVIALDISVDCLEELERVCRDPRVWYQVGSAEVLPLPDQSVDVVLTRSVLIYVREKAEAAQEFFRVLRPDGRFSIFEPVNRRNTRLWELVDFGPLRERVIEDFYRRWPPDQPLQDFDVTDLERWFTAAGFTGLDAEVLEGEGTMTPEATLHAVGAPGHPSLAQSWEEEFSAQEIERLSAAVHAAAPLTRRWPSLLLAGEKP